VIQDAPGVRAPMAASPSSAQKSWSSPAFPLVATGTDANVQVRGVSGEVLNVRKNGT